jgi:hypothetical protein
MQDTDFVVQSFRGRDCCVLYRVGCPPYRMKIHHAAHLAAEDPDDLQRAGSSQERRWPSRPRLGCHIHWYLLRRTVNSSARQNAQAHEGEERREGEDELVPYYRDGLMRMQKSSEAVVSTGQMANAPDHAPTTVARGIICIATRMLHCKMLQAVCQ